MCWVQPNQPFALAAALRPILFFFSGRQFAFRTSRAPTLKTLLAALCILGANAMRAADLPVAGAASWYGEEHRGRLMANGRRFDPDKCTAASWFYPLGTKVRVTLRAPAAQPRSVLVTITDRGPARELVRDGRIIDLAHGAFRKIAHPGKGLVAVTVSLIE
jgi:rare lipoprotein A